MEPGTTAATLDVRFARADTVIVLQPLSLVCVVGALRRTLLPRGLVCRLPAARNALTETSSGGSGDIAATVAPV